MNKIAFIGVGNMATAILNGVISCGVLTPAQIILNNRHPEKLEGYRAQGMQVAASAAEAALEADCIFLCVKPQNFPEILSELSTVANAEKKLFVSVAAGITVETIADALHGAPVVRAMPNTPMLIGKGVIALCRGTSVTDHDFAFVQKVFGACGRVLLIHEDEMNRIISVTGSSPAYVFLLIKSMLEGAAMQGLLSNSGDFGLTEKQLLDAICDTVIGSAELMRSGTKTPQEQIDTVCSKGGTTERAVAELIAHRLPEAVASAMQKCTDRANELGK